MADDAPVAVVGLLGGRPVGAEATSPPWRRPLSSPGAGTSWPPSPTSSRPRCGPSWWARAWAPSIWSPPTPGPRSCWRRATPGSSGSCGPWPPESGATASSCTPPRRRSPSPSPASACRGTTPSSAPATPATSCGWRPTWPGPKWPPSSPAPTLRRRRSAPPSSPSAPTTGWWSWPPVWASPARWSPGAPTWPTSPPARFDHRSVVVVAHPARCEGGHPRRSGRSPTSPTGRR